MSTYKDILYKKNDDETWSEWNNRVPHDEQDKLDYIGETIYAKICENDKEKASEISGLLLGIGVEDLIPLLESEELLDAKIEDAYEAIREFEEYKMSEEEVLSWDEESRIANEVWLVAKEEAEAAAVLAAESSKKYQEKWEAEELEEQERSYEIDDRDVYKQPVATITVAEMIAALSALHADAKLVMTESGFYSKSDFAEVMLPKLYIVQNDTWVSDLPTGTQVYIIGHSHQSY